MSTATEPDVREFVIDDLWRELDALRERDGLTLEEIAERAGMHGSAFRGRRLRMPRSLRIGDAARIFKALGYELSLTVTRGIDG